MAFGEYFPKGWERKKLIADKEQKTRDFIEVGKNTPNAGIKSYKWSDSPLDYTKPYQNFEPSFFKSFEDSLPAKDRAGGLKEYIEKCLKAKKGEAVGIEFGGPGIKLFEGFTPGFFKKTIGVTLVDYRDTYAPEEPAEKEHKVIQSNILSEDLYEKKLTSELKGSKVDLIIERMAGGLEMIPAEPYLTSNILQRWYAMLSENGLMLVQTPTVFDELVEKWVTMLKEKYRGVLEVQYAPSTSGDNRIPGCVLRIRKLKGAPDRLEFLNPRTVQTIKKSNP